MHNMLIFLYLCPCLQFVDDDVHWGGWSNRTGHYIMKKRHTMLCRLAIWNYHRRLQVNDNAEFDVTGMLKSCIPLCAWGLTKPSTHTYGCISNTNTWVSLCSSTCKGFGRPQIADEQKVDTHVFHCVVNLKQQCLNLGVTRRNDLHLSQYETRKIKHFGNI